MPLSAWPALVPRRSRVRPRAEARFGSVWASRPGRMTHSTPGSSHSQPKSSRQCKNSGNLEERKLTMAQIHCIRHSMLAESQSVLLTRVTQFRLYTLQGPRRQPYSVKRIWPYAGRRGPADALRHARTSSSIAHRSTAPGASSQGGIAKSGYRRLIRLYLT